MFSKCLQIFRKATTRNFCSRLNTFTWRTHTCGELNSSHSGKVVVICGWIAFQRCKKFIILKDSYGSTQVIFQENDSATQKFFENLPLESIVQVKGTVLKRPPKDVNKGLLTGEVEIEATEVKLLNTSTPKLDINAKNIEKITDVTKLKYRYLSLRSQKLQENLRLRSAILMKMREFLIHEHGFVDVETPTLFKRTPGGAKEFVVPTRFPGCFYSLTQSPQQFKQMLMVGGIDRYFQVARCYRNEGTKADRQPEFTQVDIELSFTTEDHVQSLVESLLSYSWPSKKPKIKIPFPKITYNEAMKTYGTDKPDLRYELKIQDLSKELENSGFEMDVGVDSISECGVFAIVIPNGNTLLKKKFLLDILKEAKIQSVKCFPISFKENLTWVGSITKYISKEAQILINQNQNLKSSDLLLLTSGGKNATLSFLGKCRKKIAEYLQTVGVDLIRTDEHKFVWIIDFPLFLKNEAGVLESTHHPFTAPHSADIELIYTEPMKARGQHYDLVLNGQEVAGGSIRIHDADLQKYIFEDVLKEKGNELQHLFEALRSGCPPHGGIALGMDRLLALICNCRSIAQVIAFPKSLDGKDLLSGAPSSILLQVSSNGNFKHLAIAFIPTWIQMFFQQIIRLLGHTQR